MARAFHHHLTALFPCAPRELSKNVQLCKLRLIASISNRTRPQTITETPRDIVCTKNVAQLLEVGVERVLLAMRHHPPRDERSTAANDASDPLHGQAKVFLQQSGVDSHVVDPLLRLLFAHIQKVLRLHIVDVAA